MDFRYLYTSFEGRINRKPFWIASVILALAAILLSVIVILPLSAMSSTLGAAASLALTLVILYPAVALGVKRLHDRDRPGSLMAVFIAPSLVLQLGDLLGITGSEQLIAGQSVQVPNLLGGILIFVTLIVGLWALVTLGFLSGTRGPNQYGPDPRSDEIVEPATS